MGRYRSRSRSYSPPRRKRYDDPRDRYRRRDYRPFAPSGLLVRNIALDARPEDLRIPFESFGTVKDVYLPKNYYTGEPRGFGFVKFRNPDDAAEAKEQMNHKIIGGREISIVFAEENRKTPQEMRMSAGVSERYMGGSSRRRSPRSPRSRYRSYSPSPSPSPRRDSRDRHRGTHDDDYYFPRRSISPSPRDDRSTDHTGDLQVLRGMVEAHPGLIHTDHITILQIPRGMAGAPEGPVPTDGDALAVLEAVGGWT